MTYDEPERRKQLSRLGKPELLALCIETEKLALDLREQNRGTINIANRMIASFDRLVDAYEVLAANL